MPNLTSLLRAEITRLARRQVNAEIAPLKKRWAQQRRTISELKEDCTALRRELSALSRRASAPVAAVEPAVRMRFRADGFRSFRARLGLSVRELAALLVVSEQTIYNWESETTRPQPSMVGAIAELRGLGKREVQGRLEKLLNSKAVEA